MEDPRNLKLEEFKEALSTLSKLFADMVEANISTVVEKHANAFEKRAYELSEKFMHTEYLTKSEASKVLKCSKSTINNLIRKKAFPVCRSGGSVLIRRIDIDAYMDSQRF